MKVMIKTELERAFKSWSLWLALIIGMGNNPMVGATVAVAVSIEEAAKNGKF